MEAFVSVFLHSEWPCQLVGCICNGFVTSIQLPNIDKSNSKRKPVYCDSTFYIAVQNHCVGRHCVVSIATGYGLDGLGIESRWRSPRLALGPTQPSVKWVPVLFLGRRVVEAWRWPLTLSSAQVKERVELYLYSTSGPSWTGLGWTVLFKSWPLLWIVTLLCTCYRQQADGLDRDITLCPLQTVISVWEPRRPVFYLCFGYLTPCLMPFFSLWIIQRPLLHIFCTLCNQYSFHFSVIATFYYSDRIAESGILQPAHSNPQIPFVYYFI
jgi:hypothetical protein